MKPDISTLLKPDILTLRLQVDKSYRELTPGKRGSSMKPRMGRALSLVAIKRNTNKSRLEREAA